MGIKFTSSNVVHLVCDTCGRGKCEGSGFAGDPYRFIDPPERLYRMSLADSTVWVCEECFWELTRKELKCS